MSDLGSWEPLVKMAAIFDQFSMYLEHFFKKSSSLKLLNGFASKLVYITYGKLATKFVFFFRDPIKNMAAVAKNRT